MKSAFSDGQSVTAVWRLGFSWRQAQNFVDAGLLRKSPGLSRETSSEERIATVSQPLKFLASGWPFRAAMITSRLPIFKVLESTG